MSEITERQAEHLQSLLNELGITQAQLASELGFSTTSVNRWVKGKARMRDESAKLIHERWPEYSVEWLQGGMDKRELLEDIRRMQARIDADNKRLEDAVITLIENARYSYEAIEKDKPSLRILNDDGSVKRMFYEKQHKIAKDDGEMILDDKQWSFLLYEMRQYMELRLTCMMAVAN